TAAVVAGRVGKDEFREEFILSPLVQELQLRIETMRDEAIEARGFDRIRSRLEVETSDRRTLVREADERYRGGPEEPLRHAELQAKFRDCTRGLLTEARREAAIEAVARLEALEDATALLDSLDYGARGATPAPNMGAAG